MKKVRTDRAAGYGSLLAILLLLPVPAWSWSDHASLVWPLLRLHPGIAQTSVIAEPLERFLEAEPQAIADTLSELELWAIQTVAHYPPTPEDLRWGVAAEPNRERFFAALRVNPTLPYRLYVRASPENAVTSGEDLPWAALSFLRGGASQHSSHYRQLREGEEVSVAEVLASASDEPDFGMDIGLFDDNGTDFGRRYGFGDQPFGNPNLDYGSQAPFHMGFYHLDWLSRVAQPDLLRTFPLWRIALFGELAELAFRTGHPYWGWRFLGWGLHYVGDLTQPYHAMPLPGVDTIDALWSVMQGKTGDMVQLVSNRHGVIESYQYQRLKQALDEADWAHPILRAIADDTSDAPLDYEPFVLQLTEESVAAAPAFDKAIEMFVPPRLVGDPRFEWTGSGEESDIIELVRGYSGAIGIDGLDAAVVVQLQRFSTVASRWIARGGNANLQDDVAAP